MKVIEIFLEKELGKNLGFRYNMENLFKNIDEKPSTSRIFTDANIIPENIYHLIYILF